MIAPALPRWVAEVLADAETGVNALRTQVPRGIDDAAPPEVGIYNAIDDAWVARSSPVETVTPTEWVLQVNVGEELQVSGDPLASGSADDTATIVVHLAGVAATGDNAAALAAAHRLMRAVRRCLNIAFRARRTDPLDLEGQLIALPNELTLLTQEPQPGSGAVDLALVIPFTIIDSWALGALES